MPIRKPDGRFLPASEARLAPAPGLMGRLALWLSALALTLALSGCDKEERMAGTSTSVGTGIGGRVLLADSTPAAGAVVTIRSRYLSIEGGRPGCAPLDSAVADGEGRFRLSSPPSDSFFLEIRGARSGQEVYLQGYPRQPKGADLGTLFLAAPGAVEGEVRAYSDTLAVKTWVGVIGTGNFIRVDGLKGMAAVGSAHFRLEGLAPGNRRLTVIYLPENVSAKIVPVEDLATVKSGTVTQLGLIGD